MSEESKIMVEEIIDVVIAEGESLDRTVLIEKIEDLFNKNMHKAYETFSFSLTKTKNFGYALMLNGKRKETDTENKKREAEESIRKRNLEQEELKLYLKLHNKYGKK